MIEVDDPMTAFLAVRTHLVASGQAAMGPASTTALTSRRTP